MGRKKLSEDVKISYQTIRINEDRYPYLIDFLRGNENTNSLICTLLQSSKPFIKYVERRKQNLIDREKSYSSYRREDDIPEGYSEYQPILGGFFD